MAGSCSTFSAKRGGHFVSGQLGNFAVDLLQPDAGHAVFDRFLQEHGDGAFAIVHPVPDQQALDGEIARLRKLGVRVLLTMQVDETRYTFFDTEDEGKYVLGPGAPVKGSRCGSCGGDARWTRDSRRCPCFGILAPARLS